MELKTFIQDLKQLRTEEKLKISDEILFENAIKLHISDNINKQGKKFPTLEKNSNSLATPKQIAMLRNLKIQFDDSITKQEAQKKISEKLK